MEFARELVRVSPQDEAARATLVRLLLATARREEAETHYRIGQKQIDRDGGGGTGELHAAWRQANATAPVRPAASESLREPQVVRFCTAADGVRLAYATVGQGRALAAGIPGARFVALAGRNHLLLEDEPAWPRFLAELRGFLSERRRGAPAPS